MQKKRRRAPAPPLAARQGTAVCGLALLGYFVCLGLIQLAASFFPAVLSLGPDMAVRETARLFFWNALPAAAFLPPFVWAVRALRPANALRGLCLPRAGLPRGFAPLFLALSMLASTVGGLLGRALGLRSGTGWVPEGGTSLAAAFLALCVLPALAEEVFFRGLLRAALRPYGPGAAVLGSALLFALSHGSLPQCLTALIGGLALGLCAEYCGSVWPGAALHLCNNALAFGAVWLELYADPALAGAFSLTAALLLAFWCAAAFLPRRPVGGHGPKRRGWAMPRAGEGEPGIRALFADPAFRLALAGLGLLAAWRCLR